MGFKETYRKELEQGTKKWQQTNWWVASIISGNCFIFPRNLCGQFAGISVWFSRIHMKTAFSARNQVLSFAESLIKWWPFESRRQVRSLRYRFSGKRLRVRGKEICWRAYHQWHSVNATRGSFANWDFSLDSSILSPKIATFVFFGKKRIFFFHWYF